MSCPRCQTPISNPNETFCPRCGYALQSPQSEMPTTSTPTDAPATPVAPVTPLAPQAYPTPVPDGQQPPAGPFPGYGTPPSGSFYGPGMPPPPPYPAYPRYAGYPPYPPYGVPAPGTTPLAMYPAWAPAAPPRRRNYALVSLVVVLLVAVVAGGGAALYLVANGQHGPGISLGSTSSPTATATPSYNVIFQDPLTSNINGWANDSHCFFANGGYHVKGYVCYAPVDPVSDCEVSVQVKQVTGTLNGGYGVVVRRISRGNYYAFLIAGDGKWAFGKVVNNAFQRIMPVSNEVIKRGINTTNALEVQAQGSRFTFFVNGTNVGHADDTEFSTGYVGVIGNANAEIVYNNFTVGIPS